MRHSARFLIALFFGVAQAGCRPHVEEAALEVVATVAVETVAPTTLSETAEAWGSIEFSPRGARIVEAAAEVVVDRILVEPGQAVAAGTLLVRVRGTANSSLELLKAQTDANFAAQAHARSTRLFEQKLATRSDIDLTRQTLASAQQTLANARERMGDGAAMEFRADATAVVASVDVALGSFVPAGIPLLHLSGSDAVQARLGIDAADFGNLRMGQAVSLSSPGSAQQRNGTISALFNQIDPLTHQAVAIVALAPGPSIAPGSSVLASIELAQRSAVISVALRTVLYAQDRPYLYVLINGVAEQRWVEIGQEDGRRVEIKAGLVSGESVVVEGHYVLEPGMHAQIGNALAIAAPSQ